MSTARHRAAGSGGVTPGGGSQSNRSPMWRSAVPLVVGCAGLLFVTSAATARGTDLRAGRYTDLPALVEARSDRVEELRAEAEDLDAQIDAASRRLGSAELQRLEGAIDALKPMVGLTALRGPGLVVTLDDAPADQELPDTVDPNLLVVHQQDLQAVVNALWAGGAEAMSLQGQRIIATTGIKCVGNTVVLHGVPYSPPYRIVAIGDPGRLRAGLAASHYLDNYLDYVAPPYNLGWSVKAVPTVTVPAYDGTLDLEYAVAASDGS